MGCLQFQGLVHYSHGGKHGSMQADMVLPKELRVLHHDPQATGSELSTTLGAACAKETSESTSPLTRPHLLQ